MHQVSDVHTDAFVKAAGLDKARVPLTYPKYGNVGPASIPITLAQESSKLHKGDRVYVTGRLQTRSWEAQDGSKRYKTELIGDTIIGPDQINKAGAGGSSSEGNYASAPSHDHQDEAPRAPKSAPAAKPAAPAPEEEINIDDIPF